LRDIVAACGERGCWVLTIGFVFTGCSGGDDSSLEVGEPFDAELSPEVTLAAGSRLVERVADHRPCVTGGWQMRLEIVDDPAVVVEAYAQQFRDARLESVEVTERASGALYLNADSLGGVDYVLEVESSTGDGPGDAVLTACND